MQSLTSFNSLFQLACWLSALGGCCFFYLSPLSASYSISCRSVWDS